MNDIQAQTLAARPPVKKKKGLKTLDRVFVVVMLAIPIIIFLNGWIFVNFNSVLMAFQLPSGEWGMGSFEKVFINLTTQPLDKSFSILSCLKNTGLWFLKDTLMLPFQLLIAYFLYKRITGYKVFQVIFYLPAIIPGVAVASMFSQLIMPSGPFGLLLQSFGVTSVPDFLGDPNYAMGTLMVYSLWMGWGGNMLLLGGALARIPVEVLESARLDGANTFQEFTMFIFPLVWSTLSTLFILSMTTVFSNSGPVHLFTEGRNETATMGYWIFYKLKNGGAADYNEVAAAGVLLTLIAVPVIMTIRWLIEKVEVVDY